MKILESSCRTNPRIDQLAFQQGQQKRRQRGGNSDDNDRADMMKIAKTLEEDVRRLLDPYTDQRQKQKQKERQQQRQ